MSPASALALIQALDDRRRGLLASLEPLGPEVLQARPAAGAWSMVEVIEHLVVAEQVILHGLPDPASLVERPRSLRQRCTYSLVVLILRFGIPVKVPSRRMLPTGSVPLAELRDRWDATFRWLCAYAEGLPPDGGDPAVFTHPVSGPITLRQALRLDGLHLEGHARQLRRLQPRRPA